MSFNSTFHATRPSQPSAQVVVGEDTVTVDVRYFTSQSYPALPEGQVRMVIKILPERVSGQ